MRNLEGRKKNFNYSICHFSRCEDACTQLSPSSCLSKLLSRRFRTLEQLHSTSHLIIVIEVEISIGSSAST